jgi:hypothetical protein
VLLKNTSGDGEMNANVLLENTSSDSETNANVLLKNTTSDSVTTRLGGFIINGIYDSIASLGSANSYNKCNRFIRRIL